ncbi:hypothetical protein NFC81_13115 [Salinispirillum sp. LH 10-3-1]|uniref:NADH:quinone oxidoreductase/Mrp antiporter transmembrane domain-containing protein n=1 Tax=Salinispirillum sp. LH 10-3-1 TaxID=2952525 RepID=A0AB38YEQ6_9GAMM
MTGFLWLTVPLTPLLAIIALVLWPALRDRLMPWLWLVCLPALWLVWSTPEPLVLTWLWPGAEWGLGQLGSDAVGRAFLGFTALLWAAASVFSWVSQRAHAQRLRYWVFWLLALSGNLLLIIAQDGASYYVGFTMMSLSAYGLVVHNGGPGPRHAGRVYLQLAILGEMLIYAGLLMRIFEANGLLNLADWLPAPTNTLTAVLLIVGFGLKAGFWPLHVWLPLAHPAAPAAASAVLSGAMIKAGVLGLWRFLPEADPWLQQAAPVLVGIGLISAFFGVVVGLYQVKAKSALAYSSVSQVGYLLIIVSLAWLHPEQRALWGGVLALYAVHHGLAKGALFMGAGVAMHQRFNRWYWVLMALPALALVGLPLTSGGAAKTALKAAFEDTTLVSWLVLLTVGSFGTALLLARVIWLTHQMQPVADSDTKNVSGTHPAMLGSWALVCVMPIALPWLWLELRSAMLYSLSIYASWALLWPLLLAAALVFAALKFGWRTPAFLLRLRSPAPLVAFQIKRLLSPRRGQSPASEAAWSARALERRWNRFWQKGTVAMTAWVLMVLLLLGWLW